MATENLSIKIGAITSGVRTKLSAVERALSSVGTESLGTAVKAEAAGDRIDDLGDEASETALEMLLLGNRADDAGDELLGAGGKAATAGGLFTTASVGTNGLTFSLTSLSGTITAVAIPALVALSTTLAPLVAALTGFAAIGGGLLGGFGLVVGSGALAGLETLREELQETIGLIRAQLVGRGVFFVDLLRDAIQGLPDLTRSILNAIGSLQPFADTLRRLGNIAADALPGLIGRLFDLGRQALPTVVDFAETLASDGGSFLDGIINTTETLIPLLTDVGGAFIDALPSINQFGTGLLQTLLPALADGIRGFGDLLDKIIAFTQTDEFDEILQSIQAGITELSPEVNELGKNLGTLFDALVENGPAIIDGFVAIADGVLDIVNALTPVIELFIEVLGAAAKAFAVFSERSEQQEQNLANQGILGYLGGGLSDLFGNPENQVLGGPRAASQRIEAQTGSAREVIVTVNDDRFDAYVDDRASTQVRTQERQRSRRAARNRPL
jgi:hypothetical protein